MQIDPEGSDRDEQPDDAVVPLAVAGQKPEADRQQEKSEDVRPRQKVDQRGAVGYQSNRQRNVLKASVTDLDSYLRGLEMRLMWRRFDRVGLNRTVQLINKTNQFNLTTRRYSEADVLGVMDDDRAFGAQLRLIDRFGDNGIIAIVIGRLVDGEDVLIDTWLMSCRVLGRQVEPTTLNLVAALAREMGGRRLIGEYVPTAKNGMVKDHYPKLGFWTIDGTGANTARYALDLTSFIPRGTFVEVREERVND